MSRKKFIFWNTCNFNKSLCAHAIIFYFQLYGQCWCNFTKSSTSKNIAVLPSRMSGPFMMLKFTINYYWWCIGICIVSGIGFQCWQYQYRCGSKVEKSRSRFLGQGRNCLPVTLNLLPVLNCNTILETSQFAEVIDVPKSMVEVYPYACDQS